MTDTIKKFSVVSQPLGAICDIKADELSIEIHEVLGAIINCRLNSTNFAPSAVSLFSFGPLPLTTCLS
jgi:hypothetical protein